MVGNHVLTPILGIVKESHLAGKDNPLAHEVSYAPCLSVVTAVETLSLDDGQCRSDWNVHLLPLHPYRNLFAKNRETVELEWEDYYSRAWFLGFNADPKPGDLLFASGRWIIDCGHATYHSEIHPPFVVVPMRTETYKRTTADPGRPATIAHIWVNGWYTGDPIEFDIFPPPRPSPDASLVIVKPVDADAALGVNIQWVAHSHVRIRFTASPRRVHVTDAGEMKWEAGRTYTGTWHLFWEAPPTPPRPVQPISPLPGVTP